jgi:hypothetical protein
MFKEINKCRISNGFRLTSVLNLGDQYLTGVFPKSKKEKVSKGPLELVWSEESALLQLKHSFPLDEMYGNNYGYRSGLNQSMVNHLTQKIKYLSTIVPLNPNDLVLDIGSNDATLLKAYGRNDIIRVGIDPTGNKFTDYYTDGIILIDEFFPTVKFMSNFKGQKAKVITSIAMFYDLEDPLEFVESITENLDDDGIWHLEQSYLPSMLKTNAYDTICHEHLEYYSLGNIKYLLEKCGLKIVDVQINDINGGSFAVTAIHKKSKNISENIPVIEWLLAQEERMGLNTLKPFHDFEERVYKHRTDLRELILSLNADGKKIIGYGASTKGNVMLQFCGFTENEIPYIAEVNENKFGCFTPGTHIPIISEKEARAMDPDYYLVLPWHFKHNILEREKKYRASGGKFIFPLPYIEIF